MQDNPYGLTDTEITKCENIIETGFENITKSKTQLLEKSHVRDYMDWRRDSLENGHPLTYKKKLDKLDLIIDACIPHNISYLIQEAENKSEIAQVIKVGLAALHESNLMQGHQAATKMMTTNVSFDYTDFKKTLEDFSEKYKNVR